jgi:hypothetical protein
LKFFQKSGLKCWTKAQKLQFQEVWMRLVMIIMFNWVRADFKSSDWRRIWKNTRGNAGGLRKNGILITQLFNAKKVRIVWKHDWRCRYSEKTFNGFDDIPGRWGLNSLMGRKLRNGPRWSRLQRDNGEMDKIDGCERALKRLTGFGPIFLNKKSLNRGRIERSHKFWSGRLRWAVNWKQ